ncbi:hypothetical protein GGS20DRAFT_581442 [Poronia punctata]|nr:hypothetical protein GGS20DRAFT_581442 [Poronia punctata]
MTSGVSLQPPTARSTSAFLAGFLLLEAPSEKDTDEEVAAVGLQAGVSKQTIHQGRINEMIRRVFVARNGLLLRARGIVVGFFLFFIGHLAPTVLIAQERGLLEALLRIPYSSWSSSSVVSYRRSHRQANQPEDVSLNSLHFGRDISSSRSKQDAKAVCLSSSGSEALSLQRL